jgi:hypothetical protein
MPSFIEEYIAENTQPVNNQTDNSFLHDYIAENKHLIDTSVKPEKVTQSSVSRRVLVDPLVSLGLGSWTC